MFQINVVLSYFGYCCYFRLISLLLKSIIFKIKAKKPVWNLFEGVSIKISDYYQPKARPGNKPVRLLGRAKDVDPTVHVVE